MGVRADWGLGYVGLVGPGQEARLELRPKEKLISCLSQEGM